MGTAVTSRIFIDVSQTLFDLVLNLVKRVFAKPIADMKKGLKDLFNLFLSLNYLQWLRNKSQFYTHI
ncbi:hypothetical protein BV378_15995, partial [Nostoc sp. RF31YmG]